LQDQTEITYSDLKKDENGEYITLYFERPNEKSNDFQSANCRIPGGTLEDIKGYSDEDIQELNKLVKKVGSLALGFSKEDA
jgi:tRNA U54 and U55 pseudouridine synthase Pus10